MLINIFFSPCRVFSEITDEQLFWVCSGLHREQLLIKQSMIRKGKVFQGQGEFRRSDLSGGERLPRAGRRQQSRLALLWGTCTSLGSLTIPRSFSICFQTVQKGAEPPTLFFST